MSRMGVHAGADARAQCFTYPDTTPILDVAAGSLSVTVSIDREAFTVQAVEFARQLAAQAQVFAAEVERLAAVKAAAGTCGPGGRCGCLK